MEWCYHLRFWYVNTTRTELTLEIANIQWVGWTCVASNEWYSQCVQGSSGGGGGSGGSDGGSGGGSDGGGSNSCGSASVNQLVGFGAGTTGGGSGSGTTVTSCSALQSAISKGGVISISGTLSGCGSMRLVSGTTIKGVGSNSGK
jgi:pectate lyase